MHSRTTVLNPWVPERLQCASRRGPISAFTISLFFHPSVQLLFSVLFAAAAQVFLRLGANGNDGWAVIAWLQSGWIWGGIGAHLISLLSWLHVLRFMKLLIAYNLSGLLHVLVPLAGWIVLGERIPAVRWIGITLVLVGVMVVAAPVAKVEERL